MRVSVVVPTYNSAGLVVEAVESVLSQTRPADQVVVVDDGSTDDTPGRLKRFGGLIQYVRKPNGGVSSARNRGVREADGDVVAFLDADDVWHPKKLQIQVDCLESNPRFAMLGAGLFDWPAPSMPQVEAAASAPSEVPFDRLVVHNPFCTSTIVVRADALRAAGEFDCSLQGPEDFDMWIRISAQGPVGLTTHPLTGYRRACPNSLSKNAARMEEGLRRIFRKLESTEAFAGKPLLRRRAWGHLLYNCGYMHRQAGARAAAARRVVESFLQYPFAYDASEIRYPMGRLRLLASTLFLRTASRTESQ